MFLYLGRRGALGQFTWELSDAAARIPELDAQFTLSSSNRFAALFKRYGSSFLCLDTFDKPLDVLRNFPAARRRLLAYIRHEKPMAVITLMPHVWTPLLARDIRRLGIRYATVIHDAQGHPGDSTGSITWWLRREVHAADLVITLSRTVADRLLMIERIPPSRILPLFHPNLSFHSALANRSRQADRPLRLLFFGRILPYKGLPLLIETLELLRKEGIKVDLGVAGDGDLSTLRERLVALDAEIINRWLDEDEIAPLLARYDAIALAHVEASQSGVAAAAFGACMPVVGMPVGGIAEQVINDRTGVLSHRISARSFADAIHRLAADAALYERISAHLTATAEDRSMERFISDVVAELVGLERETSPAINGRDASRAPGSQHEPKVRELAQGRPVKAWPTGDL